MAGRLGREILVASFGSGNNVRKRIALSVTVIGPSLIVPANASVAAESAAPVDLAEAGRLRGELGLDARSSVVAELAGSALDVGSSKWGIPMTRQEDLTIDLGGRMAFADHIDTKVLPEVSQLETFAGAYYHPADGGRLSVLLTSPDDETVAQISTLIGDTQRDWEVVSARFSHTALLAAVHRAEATWKAVIADKYPLGFGIDTRANGVFVELAESDLPLAPAALGAFESALGVPVAVRAGVLGRDTHCSTRDHCHGPMKAGINIYKGSNYSGGWCTMGFHITRSGDEQFVTSGHCGYGGSNSQFHPAFTSAIGTEQQSLYTNGGQDIMRVSMSDAQASDDIYNYGNNIVGSGTPTTGETLCASLGKGSNTVKCGTVQDDWRSWISDTADPDITVWGGDMSYSTTGGDSGSPVYRRLPGGTGDDARAIGVNANALGMFARLDQSLDDFAASVVQ